MAKTQRGVSPRKERRRSGAPSQLDPTAKEQPPSRWLSELMAELSPIHEAHDLPDLYAGLARSIMRSLAADGCLVSLLSDDGDVLRDVAASVRPPTKLNSVAESYRLRDFPVTQQVIRSGSAVEISVSDPSAHATEKSFLDDLGFKRVLIHPLNVEGRTIGTVEAYRAVDRPFRADDPQLIALITTFADPAHARIRLASELESHYTATIAALASTLEARDPETNAHTGRIKDFAVALAEAMKVPAEIRQAVLLGALLHDVGKIGIPDAILLKDGPLSEDEWAVMKKHPQIGEKMLKDVDFLRPALPIVKHHHERWDGTGYPDRLAQEDIPLGARIVAVCDSFDAMTSDRPYRRALPLNLATQELLDGAGTQFDPTCAALLVEVVRSFGESGLDGAFVRYAT